MEAVRILALFGGVALLAGLAVGAFFVTKRRRLAAVIGGGLAAAGFAWVLADSAGLLESEGSEDLAPILAVALIVANFAAWTLGVLLGAIWGLRRRGSIAGELVKPR